MTNGKGFAPSKHTPAPSEPSSGALADAQAIADATARRFVDSSNLSYDERAALVDQLHRDAAAARALTVHPGHDWTTHQAYRAFGEEA